MVKEAGPHTADYGLNPRTVACMSVPQIPTGWESRGQGTVAGPLPTGALSRALTRCHSRSVSSALHVLPGN